MDPLGAKPSYPHYKLRLCTRHEHPTIARKFMPLFLEVKMKTFLFFLYRIQWYPINSNICQHFTCSTHVNQNGNLNWHTHISHNIYIYIYILLTTHQPVTLNQARCNYCKFHTLNDSRQRNVIIQFCKTSSESKVQPSLNLAHYSCDIFYSKKNIHLTSSVTNFTEPSVPSLS